MVDVICNINKHNVNTFYTNCICMKHLNFTCTGLYNLPLACLEEPSAPKLVRPVDEVFVQQLVEEMTSNPTSDVAPMIGVANLHGESFNPRQPEAYSYEVIGGNNSRAALLTIQTKFPELASSQNFRVRPVSGYRDLSNEEAQYLAVKHNRATHFTHAMTTQEKVG